MYNINIRYTTGDSYSSREKEQLLSDIDWKNIEIVEENLERIKTHYKYYSLLNRRWYTSSKEQKEVKKEAEKLLKENNFLDKKYEFSLKLLADSGKEYTISAFWCGYFETLHSAEIVFRGKAVYF